MVVKDRLFWHFYDFLNIFFVIADTCFHFYPEVLIFIPIQKNLFLGMSDVCYHITTTAPVGIIHFSHRLQQNPTTIWYKVKVLASVLLCVQNKPEKGIPPAESPLLAPGPSLPPFWATPSLNRIATLSFSFKGILSRREGSPRGAAVFLMMLYFCSSRAWRLVGQAVLAGQGHGNRQ